MKNLLMVIRTTEIKKLRNSREEFVETPCKCGCGMMVRTSIQPYLSHAHYGKHLSQKNKAKRLALALIKQADKEVMFGTIKG